MRGHIIRLQARSRGYLIRREMTRKKWAVIKIQSNVRRMIAQRDYRRMRVERRARYVFTEKTQFETCKTAALPFPGYLLLYVLLT